MADLNASKPLIFVLISRAADLATRNNDRFIFDRRGEPAVVIISVQDFIRLAAPAPDWLDKASMGAKQ
jgi:hypothetical protein